MGMSHEELVVGLHEIGVMKFSNFEWKLKSGRQSPFYFNIRPVTSVNHNIDVHPEKQTDLMYGVVDAYSDAINRLGVEYTHLHGIAQAATVLGGLIAYERADSYIWERIGAKDYGVSAQFEGHINPGDRVVTIDDVVTDGASKIETAKKLEEAGLVVAGMVIGMDRGEGGIENVRSAGYVVEAVMTLGGVANVLLEAGRIGSQEIEWIDQYHDGLRADGLL